MKIEAANKGECLSQVVSGRSFADVGGLWGTKGEMVSHALRHGAASAAMIDAMPFSQEWWQKFRDHCRKLGISGVREFSTDIMSPALVRQVGRYDVVHCSGVMYHLPDCWGFVQNLLSITNEYLLLTSEVIPSVIENGRGRIEVSDGGALCTPCLSETERAVINEHYSNAGRNIESFSSSTRFVTNLRPNYGPWWWLFTRDFMDRMLETFEVNVVWRSLSLNGMVYMVLVKK